MKKDWVDSAGFQRFLEILPGVCTWLFLIAPFALAFFAPTALAVFILAYSFYWFFKAINIARHLVVGYQRLRRNMSIDWLKMLARSESYKDLRKFWAERYGKTKNRYDHEDMNFINNLEPKPKIKDWEEIIHVVLIAVSSERLDILEPTIEAIEHCNYPNEKIMLVLAAEDRCKSTFLPDYKVLKKKFGGKFTSLDFYLHKVAEGEVIGKGANITSAGKLFWEDYKDKGLKPENVLLTNLDADHIIHEEYLARLSYLYAIDPNRHNKSYQPIPLLFNNIWDVPALNRIGAVSSSFWMLVESMRTYRLRTFAAHTQSLKMLLATDFWAVNTVVEDGHQFWRSYFTLNGDHQMVAVYLPVYQDAVMGESLWASTKNHYLQKRRWAWGVTDFPYVVRQCLKHSEISVFERCLQVFRQFSSHFSWATSSVVLAVAWIPLLFNRGFQDQVIAHNISSYSSQFLQLAWVGIIANVWISLALFPPKPKKYGFTRTLGMFAQWVLSPPYAVLLSSLPAIESQTRLMFGQKLEVFWITPKARLHRPVYKKH